MVSSPSPPDPKETASAQTGTNVNTAIANAALGHTNQITNDGSLTYSQTGTTKMTAQDGSVYDLPTYTATQKLSDSNQRIYDTNQVTKQNLADIGQQQSGKIGGILNSNIDLSSGNIDKYSNTHWQPGFDRQWNNQRDALTQKLADQGIHMGSEAYNRAYSDFNTQRQQQENQYLGDMYKNSMAAITQERNQPINEISALMGGSQINAPNYVNTPSTQLPTVDYSGLVNENYNQRVGIANQQNQGLFGLAGALLGGLKLSDRRLKSKIEPFARLANGLTVYGYEIAGEHEFGLMADEVAAVRPEAVYIGNDGFARVNYSQAVR